MLNKKGRTGIRCKFFSLCREKCAEHQGETLFEVVASIFLFSMMVLMVASMFGMANKVSERNYATEAALDEAINKIVTESGILPEDTDSVTVTFQAESGIESYTVNKAVERINAGGLYKFR